MPLWVLLAMPLSELPRSSPSQLLNAATHFTANASSVLPKAAGPSSQVRIATDDVAVGRAFTLVGFPGSKTGAGGDIIMGIGRGGGDLLTAGGLGSGAGGAVGICCCCCTSTGINFHCKL